MPELPKKSKPVTKGNLNAMIDQDVIDTVNLYVKYLQRPLKDRPSIIEQLIVFALQSDKGFQKELQEKSVVTGINGDSKAKKTAAA